MENMYIEHTKSTPRIDFRTDGLLKIEGRSLPEDANSFYQPVFQWLNGFSSENVTINVNLEYCNTSSSKQILTILKMLSGNPSNKHIKVNWYYEEGDLDTLEAGEHYSELLKIPFNFIECEESVA